MGMERRFNPRYLFFLSILIWIGVVIIFIAPLEQGKRKIVSAAVCFVGILILACIRALWRWFQGDDELWANHR
jgi:hypothetical protein